MLTIVMAVYGQPKMLAHQLATISRYGDDVLDQLKMVIVDDHGDPPASIVPPELAAMVDLKLFRVTEDIPWNQMGARNIGMRESEGWVVMLDPDMVIEPEMISKFIDRANTASRGTVTKFALRWPGHPLGFTSPNTWLVHKRDFFDCGGYDEDFRGHKGWSDCLLQECFRSFYKVVDAEYLWVTFHNSGQRYDDAQVRKSAGVDRSTAYNKKLKVMKADLIRRMGGHKRYISRKLKGKNFRCSVTQVI